MYDVYTNDEKSRPNKSCRREDTESRWISPYVHVAFTYNDRSLTMRNISLDTANGQTILFNKQTYIICSFYLFLFYRCKCLKKEELQNFSDLYQHPPSLISDQNIGKLKKKFKSFTLTLIQK